MGARVYHTSITVDILLRIFQSFQPRNVFHACMHAAFLVPFFSFPSISNLVPYTLSKVHSSTSFFLRRRDITFTASGAYLKVFRTKTIQFRQLPIYFLDYRWCLARCSLQLCNLYEGVPLIITWG